MQFEFEHIFSEQGQESLVDERADPDRLKVQEAANLMAEGDYIGAEQVLEELGRAHAADIGIDRLSKLLLQTVRVDSMHHAQEPPLLEPYTSMENVEAASTATPATSSIAFLSKLQNLSKELLQVVHETPTSKVAFVEAASHDAKVYVDLLWCFLISVYKPLRLVGDRFVSIVPATRQLQNLRRNAMKAAEKSFMFQKPVERLALETQLLETLLAAEFKTSLLKGVEGFAHLSCAEQLLRRYLSGFESDRSSSVMPASTSQGGVTSQLPTSSPRTRIMPPSRSAPAIQVSPSSAQRKDGNSPRRHHVGPKEIPQLELWYLWFYSHVLGRLRLFCGSGFHAAASLGPRQIAESGGGGVDVGSASAAGKTDRALGPTRMPRSHDVPRCRYAQNLRNLAGQPGVAFAGVFANAKQLPHLQASQRHPSAAGTTTNVGLAAPFNDSAWLLTPPVEAANSHQIAATIVGANDIENHWWALEFVAAASDGSEVKDGREALDAWKGSLEWFSLRSALGDLCVERHAPRCNLASESSQHLSPKATDPCATSYNSSSNLLQAAAVPSVLRKRNLTAPLGSKLPLRKDSDASLCSREERCSGPSLGLSMALSSPRLNTSSLDGKGMHPSYHSEGSPPSDRASDRVCELLGHSMDLPEAPHCQNFEGDAPPHRGSIVSEHDGVCGSQPYRCLMMPLDLGWFPTPIFLGLVIRESSTATSPLSSNPRRRKFRAAAAATVGRGCISNNISVSTASVSSGERSKPSLWQRMGQLFKKSGGAEAENNVDETIENDILALAFAISGRNLRLSQAQHNLPSTSIKS